jgi:hypothetical protein
MRSEMLIESNLRFDPCVRPHRREMTDLAPVVLVIDDEASVRNAPRDLFESAGLRVMVCGHDERGLTPIP